MVCLGRSFHKVASPGFRLVFAQTGRHLPRLLLVTLVSNQHYRNVIQLQPFNFFNDVPDGVQLLQALSARDRIDQNEGVAFRNGKALHCWKLVRSCCVRDLQCADVLVARNHLLRKRDIVIAVKQDVIYRIN